MEKEMMIETNNLIKDLEFHQDEILRIQKEIDYEIREYIVGVTDDNFQNKVDLRIREYDGVVITIEFDDYTFFYCNETLTYRVKLDKCENDVMRFIHLSGIVSSALLTLEYEVKKQ